MAVAQGWGINNWTMGKWYTRFVNDRLAAPADKPCPGGLCAKSDEWVLAVVNRTLSRRPNGTMHRSARTMTSAPWHTSLFAALDTTTDAVIGQCHPRHRHREVPKLLGLLERSGHVARMPSPQSL